VNLPSFVASIADLAQGVALDSPSIEAVADRHTLESRIDVERQSVRRLIGVVDAE
jgi:hypothetical protein